MNAPLFTVLVGVGATLMADAWGFARKPLLGVPPPDYRLVGRWIGHMRHGQLRHDAIARSPAINGEAMLGWSVHYAIGVAFAALLMALGGTAWMQRPTLGLALGVGLATVAAPFLLMQPGMGAGIAASRTPNPAAARIQSVLMHAAFGVGLYLSALFVNLFVTN